MTSRVEVPPLTGLIHFFLSSLRVNIKVLNSSYFPDHRMDLVYIWYDDRYGPKFYLAVLLYISAHDLKITLFTGQIRCLITLLYNPSW